MKKNTFTLIVFILIFILACSKDEESQEIQKNNFNSPAEFLDNPAVKSAINESGINIHLGDTPPSLTGTYLADGEVTDASSVLSTIVDMPIYSEIRLYNQTASGKIDFQEKVGEITAWGSGGFITGDNGSFSIWQESIQTGTEAGLADDVTISVVLLMSGTQLSNGDLTAEGISIITKVETDNPEYDAELLEGLWWIWDADFEKQTTKSVNIRLENTGPGLLMQGVLESVVRNIELIK